jgi:hypothetical protein
MCGVRSIYNYALFSDLITLNLYKNRFKNLQFHSFGFEVFTVVSMKSYMSSGIFPN